MSPRKKTPLSSEPKEANLKDTALRDASFALRYLEQVIDSIYLRLQEAEGADYARLVNALARATVVLLNGHRILTAMEACLSPIDKAVEELMSLPFEED